VQILINDLLDYSRVQTKPQKFAMVDCEKIVKNCIANLNASIKESGATVLFDSMPHLMVDASQLSQVLQNLIGNALKFCPADRPPTVRIAATSHGLFWLFSVEDNGIGIETEFLERIFLVFRRLHSRAAYAGTGIGLAVCQRIVQGHGGKIWAESKPGVGSKFCFTVLKNPLE
jgi:light-regulated signal transduction histidine kinase (bacteriophytochrome)